MENAASFDDQGRYVAVTDGITVRVRPAFLPAQSDPEAGRYLWAYEVSIENDGDVTVQLLNRYWRITDGLGRVDEVRGPGVVGRQPVLAPGKRFTYTSGCPLTTPGGIMVGHYEMQTGDGARILAAIPGFSLDLPDDDRPVN